MNYKNIEKSLQVMSKNDLFRTHKKLVKKFNALKEKGALHLAEHLRQVVKLCFVVYVQRGFYNS